MNIFRDAVRRRRQRGHAAAALILPVLMAGAGAAVADTIERQFDTGPYGRLVLESDVGGVTIESGTGGGVEVVVERDGRDGDALEVSFEQRGDEIRVIGRMDRGRPRLDIEYRVRLPRGFTVEVDTAGGSIRVDDLDGDLDVNTAGGYIRLANMGGTVLARTAGGSIDLDTAAGNVDLKTAGGSISINRAGGRVNAKTAGGSISIDEAGGEIEAKTAGGSIRIGASGGSVVAHTAGGSISVEDVQGSVEATTNGGSISASIRSQPAGDSKLRTSGGSVTVTLAPGVALDVDAYSSNSRITSDFNFPPGDYDEDRAELRTRLNGGGPRLDIRASHRIRLRREQAQP